MHLTDPTLPYWLLIHAIDGIGPVNFRKYFTYFGGVQAIFSKNSSELMAAGMPTEHKKAILAPDWGNVDKTLRWCEDHRCHIITFEEASYPILLKELSDAPPVLFVLGDLALLNQPQLAIVGSRNPTPAGRETATQFAYALSEAGLVITSGLALGIDTASHKGALAANGKTIAVMGTGIKTIYPSSNRGLAGEICENGALISEFPLHAPPKAWHFPLRNRVISGLSLGVLVVEAALKSGSLITARKAADQGRDVFAIPSSIHHPLGKGCHHLIRQGAKLVETVDDILVELGPLQGCLQKNSPQSADSVQSTFDDLDDAHVQLLMKIGFEPTALDTIVYRGGLTPSRVSSMLLSLELKSYVKGVPGGYLRIR